MTEITNAPGITITRIFDAPRELVYQAWTDPAQFAAWFGGTEVNVPLDTVSMDLRVGGERTAKMIFGEEPNEIAWHGVYLELDEPNKIVLTLSDRPGDEAEIVTVVLSEAGNKTEMRFTQHGDNLTPEQYEGAKAGWITFFDAMAGVLASA